MYARQETMRTLINPSFDITMKIQNLSFLAPLCGVVSGAPFVSTTSSAALSVRGGGGIFPAPLTAENLSTLYAAQLAVNGAIGLPAPTKLAGMYGGESHADACSGSTLGELCYEYIGSANLSVLLAALLSLKTDLAASKIVAYASIPCFYSTWRNLLNDNFQKLGLPNGYGTRLFVSFLPFICILFGWTGDNADLLAKIGSAFPLLGGAVELLLEGKDAGLEITDGDTLCAWKWCGRQTFLCGLMFYLLLNGMEATKAIGWMAFAYGLFVLDYKFISKDAEGVAGQSDTPIYLVTAVNFLIAAGTLLSVE